MIPSPPLVGALFLTSLLLPLGCENASSVSGRSDAFSITFQIHDVSTDERGVVRAALRMKTSNGRTFDYAAPVSHARCYLLENASAAPRDFVDGDGAHLVCAGGGQTDEAIVRRRSETTVEVSFFQKAFEAPDTRPATPRNEQTFVIAIPRGATLRTIFQSDPGACVS